MAGPPELQGAGAPAGATYSPSGKWQAGGWRRWDTHGSVPIFGGASLVG